VAAFGASTSICPAFRYLRRVELDYDRLSWRAYVGGIVGGAVDGVVWALSFPNRDQDLNWVMPILRLLVAVFVGGLLGMFAIRLVSRIIRRIPASSPWETQLWVDIAPWDKSAWPPGTWAGHFPLAWRGGIATFIGAVLLFGPVALLLLAAVLHLLGIPAWDATRPAFVIAAIIATPLAVRIGRAVTRHYDHRLNAQRGSAS
jgi:hypothetical protein